MESVGVRELRQYLSVYLRRVKAGESLRVTEHGRVVATLQPASPSDDPLHHLTVAGLLDPPTAPFHAPVPVDLHAAADCPDLAGIVESHRDDRLE